MTALDYVAEVSSVPIGDILRRYPLAVDYLANIRLVGVDETKTLPEILENVDEDMLEEFGLDREEVIFHFSAFLEAFSRMEESIETISSITILGGRDKAGRPEMLELTVTPGEVVSIVGPTGSGKSRLLEDIECLAQRDTPTARQILINGSVPDLDKRFSTGGKLVAQLSQNMNFVMDLTVQEFLEMHAKSRMIPDSAAVVEKCFAVANSLAGEKFTLDTKVTQLSGGAVAVADDRRHRSLEFIPDHPHRRAGECRNRPAGGDRDPRRQREDRPHVDARPASCPPCRQADRHQKRRRDKSDRNDRGRGADTA
jgi:ABC-type lipoprotein export system ATPase subunit